MPFMLRWTSMYSGTLAPFPGPTTVYASHEGSATQRRRRNGPPPPPALDSRSPSGNNPPTLATAGHAPRRGTHLYLGEQAMRRTLSFVAVIALVIALSPIADASVRATFSPGAPGVGDPYFPLDGNGGYDVQHYGLNLTYDPATDRLGGGAPAPAAAAAKPARCTTAFTGATQ